MDINDAIIAAQVRLNEVTGFDQRFCLIHKAIQENEYGWLIPWANKEVVTKGIEALRIGGNLPFFVDRRNAQVYQYHRIAHLDLIEWWKKLPADPSH